MIAKPVGSYRALTTIRWPLPHGKFMPAACESLGKAGQGGAAA
jgi:hypothetical protein